VLRGFIHAIFDFNGYKLHIFGAQLKDQTKHPKYLHTNMRRYEARVLKKLVSAVIKKDLNANVLVLADLNDSCGKSPVKAVYARRFGLEKRVFDIRPLDSINVSWTFLDEGRDEYNRVDYALVSFNLIPELNYEKCAILETPNWRKLSAHRAIVVSISCVDKELWEANRVKEAFPNSIRSNEASIGIKRKRD
jgi:endonuclease/exonuclease/phosphatase family metal-dependent hydrolase